MNRRDLEQFNEMVDRFSNLGIDESASMGMAGIMAQQRKAIEENTIAVNHLAEPDGFYRGGASAIVRPPSPDVESEGGLVEQMVRSTFTVRVDNAFNSIVDPMYRRMSLLAVEDRLYSNDLHKDSMAVQRHIVRSINNLNTGNNKGLMSLYLSYKEFMRHPVWNSLTAVGAFIRDTSLGLLFGFKKRQSDTDRIVEAIQKQTEFMRTGAIDNTSGFFSRLMRQGIVGMPARAIGESMLGFTGVSRDNAQNREDTRAAGGPTDNGLAARLSTMLYGGSIRLRGTQEGANGGMDDNPQLTLVREILQHVKNFALFAENMRDSMDVRVIKDINGEHEIKQQSLINERIIKRLEGIGLHTNRLTTPLDVTFVGAAMNMAPFSVHMEGVKELVGNSDRVSETLASMATNSEACCARRAREHTDIMTSAKVENEQLQALVSLNEEQSDQGRHQVKWLKRLRDGQIMASMMRMAGLALTGIQTLLGGISSAIMGIAGTVAALLKLRSMGGRNSRRSNGSNTGTGAGSNRSNQPPTSDGPDSNNRTNNRTGRFGKFGKFAKLGGKAFGALGAPIAAFSAWGDKNAELEERTDITDKQKNIIAGGSAVGAGGGALGGAMAGGALGAAAGSVVPIVGTAIGGILGSAIGGLAGAWGGEKVGSAGGSMMSKFFGGEKEMEKSVEESATKEAQKPSPMTSVVSKGKEVYKDSKSYVSEKVDSTEIKDVTTKSKETVQSTISFIGDKFAGLKSDMSDWFNKGSDLSKEAAVKARELPNEANQQFKSISDSAIEVSLKQMEEFKRSTETSATLMKEMNENLAELVKLDKKRIAEGKEPIMERIVSSEGKLSIFGEW